MTPTGLVWMARRPCRQARRACRHGRRARTSSRASEPVTPLKGGAAAKNAPRNHDSIDSILAVARCYLGRFWTKMAQILPGSLFFNATNGNGSGRPDKKSKVCQNPILGLFWALFRLQEADIHSPNLPLVKYYPSGVRHIRWDLSRNNSE